MQGAITAAGTICWRSKTCFTRAFTLRVVVLGMAWRGFGQDRFSPREGEPPHEVFALSPVHMITGDSLHKTLPAQDRGQRAASVLMAARSPIPRLTDIVEASALIRREMQGVTNEAFEADIRKRWLVERGVEIISEASRRLPDDLKVRHRKFHGRRSAASATCCARISRHLSRVSWRMTIAGAGSHLPRGTG